MIAKRAAWFALLMLCLCLSLGFAGEAFAQAYPSRPITLIVPFPAGGPTDTLARVLADRLKTALGQPIIIENVSGAGGSLGVGRAARAAPDGYTLSIGHVQTHVINGAVYKLPYDIINDFEPISLITDTPQWIVGKTSLPSKDVAELIAWMKERPGKATVGSVGVGGPPDLAAISFQKQTGTSFQLVPYRGGAPLLQDLMAGQIDLTFGQAANYLAHVRGGQLRPYAVLSSKRWWAAPDVPTLTEAGVGGPTISFWHGLWVPKGTPKEVLARLDAAVHESLADATLRQRFSDIGQEIWPLDQQTPQALRALQQSEAEKWWPVVKAANIKGE
jgi:tripartite-type tricarboxylate transporter receptor subunit TctC